MPNLTPVHSTPAQASPQAKPPTLAQVKAYAKAYGCTLRHRDGEYRVNLIGGTEAQAYYTNDRADAMGTARAMSLPHGPKGDAYRLESTPSGMVCIKPDEVGGESPLPTAPKWVASADFPTPPPIGARVRVRINGLGVGTVFGYFVEGGWIGVRVLPDVLPEWYADQHGPARTYCLAFSAEVESVPEAQAIIGAPSPQAQAIIDAQATPAPEASPKAQDPNAPTTVRGVTAWFIAVGLGSGIVWGRGGSVAQAMAKAKVANYGRSIPSGVVYLVLQSANAAPPVFNGIGIECAEWDATQPVHSWGKAKRIG